jgi:hypothetical protein
LSGATWSTVTIHSKARMMSRPWLILSNRNGGLLTEYGYR